jgi:hypothetical protein
MLTTKEICFAISTFNCKTEFERCVNSLPQDSFIMQGDGAYPEFAEVWIGDTKCQMDQLMSSDGTTEVIHSLGRKGFVFSFVGPQIEKRQAIADRVAELGYRYMIVIDSDEYVGPESNWNEFLADLSRKSIRQETGNVFDIPIHTDKDYVKASNVVQEGWRTYPRIWFHPGLLEYFELHWWIRRKEMTEREAVKNRHERLGSQIAVKGVNLYHDSKLRTKRFKEAREYWASEQLLSEKKAQNLYLGFPADRRF